MLTTVDFSPPQDARFCIYSPENVHFKKSVKYNLKTGINHKGHKSGRISGVAVLEIAEQEHKLSALNASVRRYLLTSLLKVRCLREEDARVHEAAGKSGTAMQIG